MKGMPGILRAAAIVSLGLVVASALVGGRFIVATGGATGPVGGTIYIVDRLTGGVRGCNFAGCMTLPDRSSPGN